MSRDVSCTALLLSCVAPNPIHSNASDVCWNFVESAVFVCALSGVVEVIWRGLLSSSSSPGKGIIHPNPLLHRSSRTERNFFGEMFKFFS